MAILSLLPALFGLVSSIFGSITSEHKTSIISSIIGGGFDGTAGSLVNIVEGAIGKIEDEKRLELQAQIQTLLAQSQINVAEVSQGFYQSGWRPFLAWALSIIVALHLSIAEIFNVLHTLGYITGVLAPMDTITLTLITGLLGLYMGARTVEKVNANTN